MSELVTLRKSRGLSQRELAELANVSPATVYEMEAGRRPQPRGSTLRKLAGALGVDVSELLEIAHPPKAPRPLSAEWALSVQHEVFQREVKAGETDKLHRLLSQLVSDDYTRTLKDARAGLKPISDEAFSRALEVRAELIERGEEAPEKRLPTFKRRLEALHLA